MDFKRILATGGAGFVGSNLAIRIYVTDCTKVDETFGWRPTRTTEAIIDDIAKWIADHRDALRPVFAG